MTSFSVAIAHFLTLTSTRYTSQTVHALSNSAPVKRYLNPASNSLRSNYLPIIERTHPASSKVAMKSTLNNSNGNHQCMDLSFSFYLTSTLPTDIQNLLESCKSPQQNDSSIKKNDINFIMGNQAGDADSIISSLALSYVKNLDVNDQEESKMKKFLPIICIEKEDLALRRDVVLLLQMAGIVNHESFMYLNDDTFKSTVINEDVPHIQKSFTLVDHNKIRSELMKFDQAVTEIYDHHQDEGCHMDSCVMREIAFENQKATVGSTCTVVTENLMRIFVDSAKKVDGGLGLSLLGVILLDTMNMSPEAAKGTPRDESAIEFLLENSDWKTLDAHTMKEVLVEANNGQVRPDRVKLYEYLRDSKFDRTFWQEMSARDALRIDYKRFEPDTSSGFSFGLSSVLLDSKMILSKPDFCNSALDYMKEVNVDMIGVLCMVIVNDTPQREIIMFGKQDEMDTLAEYLQNDSSTASLKIAPTDEGNNVRLIDEYVMKTFRQGNPKGSRKQIAPVLLSFFKQT